MELIERNRFQRLHRTVEALNGCFVELQHIRLDLDLREAASIALIEGDEVQRFAQLDSMSSLRRVG